jgi:dihydroorotate dehydrogenase
VQLYSAMVYEGPGLVRRVRRELDACLAADGFASLEAAIGADHG